MVLYAANWTNDNSLEIESRKDVLQPSPFAYAQDCCLKGPFLDRKQKDVEEGRALHSKINFALASALSPSHELLVRQAVKGQPLPLASNRASNFFALASQLAEHDLQPSKWTGRLHSKEQKTEDHNLELRNVVKLPSDKQHTDL